MAKNTPEPQSRAEKILAFMAVGVIALAIVCILVTLIFKAFSSAPYVIFEQIPLLALPAGALLIIALFITAALRRSKSNR